LVDCSPPVGCAVRPVVVKVEPMTAPPRSHPRRRTSIEAVALVIASAIALAAVSGCGVDVTGPAAAAGPTDPAVSCPFLEGAAGPATIEGRLRTSFEPVFHPDPDQTARSCTSGREPEVVLVVSDETLVPGEPLPLPDGASAAPVTSAPAGLRVDHLRSSSPSSEVDTIRVSDGRQVVSVGAIWSSVDPADGRGPGSPDIPGAIAVAESILAG
jgi:hypothetical protein